MVSDQVGVGQFHFSRSIITLALVVIFSHIFGYSLRPKLWRPLLARTGFIVFAMLIYFSVIPMMPIAEAGAGLFTSPIFVLLFSSFLFKEKIGWRRTFAVFIGTIGVLLIIQPGIGGFPSIICYQFCLELPMLSVQSLHTDTSLMRVPWLFYFHFF